MEGPAKGESSSIPIPMTGHGHPKSDAMFEQASGAFSLGRGSYLRSIQDVVTINYEGIDLKYTRPKRRAKKTLAGDDRVQVQETLSAALLEYLRSASCYDALPTSGQVVVLDIDLPLSVAFISALENRIPYGTLWDAGASKAVGMMTVTDYINVLLQTRQGGETIAELQNRSIRSWRAGAGGAGAPPHAELVSARIDHNLLAALDQIRRHKVRRLPVMAHTGEVVSLLSLQSLLSAVLRHILTMPENDWVVGQLSYSVRDLGIGTFTGCPSCTLESKVYEVLQQLIDANVHCLPVVDAKGRCLDVFTRNDVMHIEQGGTYDIELTLATAIANRPRLPVATCSPDDTLYEVMRHLARAQVSTLVAVDQDDVLCGSVTLAQIFDWLLEKRSTADDKS